jgi:large subunit ribosomal protein L17
MANLTSALFEQGKINRTLAKAKALRPFTEKVITMAVKAHKSTDFADKLHYKRLTITRIRSEGSANELRRICEGSAKELFDVKMVEFIKRHGGYTRIYKLVVCMRDAAKKVIIELIYADHQKYSKPRRTKKRTTKQNKPDAGRPTEPVTSETNDETSETAA